MAGPGFSLEGLQAQIVKEQTEKFLLAWGQLKSGMSYSEVSKLLPGADLGPEVMAEAKAAYNHAITRKFSQIEYTLAFIDDKLTSWQMNR
jgi:hypothetical protein